MLHFYSSQDLQNLLDSYCKFYNDDFENILHKVSKFSVRPSWWESKLLSRDMAMDYAPQYVLDRQDMLLKNDDYSKPILPTLNSYYSDLSVKQPKVYEFCNSLIKLILIAGLESYREGTTAEGLGIAHIDFKPHFNRQDFNELIVHQITHLLLYYNDVINPQVPSKYKSLSLKTMFQHKRGGQEFPLYILFHSFCVAVEVLQYRIDTNTVDATVNYHSDSQLVIKRCKSCVEMLRDNSEYFSEQGEYVLEKYISSFTRQESMLC